MGNVNQFPWAIASVLLVFGAFPKVSGNCEVTDCGQLQPNASPCRWNMEEISRESCSFWGRSGEMAYCCPKNSTESLLSTTFGAELNEFPHMGQLTTDGRFSCGATIYNKRYILTAAHCVVKEGIPKRASELAVKVGRNIGRIEMPTNDYQVEQLIIHPKYSSLMQNRVGKGPFRGVYYDIALLRLNRDVEFGDRVKSLEIAPKGFNEMAYGDNAVIAGWGTTHTFRASDHLQKTNVIIRKDETCFGTRRGKRVPWYMTESQHAHLPPQLLCVGGHWDGINHPTAGTGDSGGPAICRGADGYGVLCGVTSFGGGKGKPWELDRSCFDNGDEDHCEPSVYVEVDYFRDWIVGNAGPQDPRTFHKVKLYGETAPSRRSAHQVHITSDGGKPCGGTLIAPDTVVTAAQCVAPGRGSVKAYTGIKVTSVNQGGKTYLVKSLNILPRFERMAKKLGVAARDKRMISSYKPWVLEHMVLSTDRYFKNDLAVLKLKEKMNVDPRALPELANADDRLSQPAYELSIPRNTTRGSGLMQREFNILDRDECVRRMNRMDKVGLKVHVDENVLCGVEKYSGGSTCDRELGGGLICTGRNGKDTLCGVQTLRLCQWSIPNGFLDVRKHLDWIKKARNSQLNDAIVAEYPPGGGSYKPEKDDEWHPQINQEYRGSNWDVGFSRHPGFSSFNSGFKPLGMNRNPGKFGQSSWKHSG